MRIAVGQLWQETNTLNPIPTTRADFDALGVWRGAEMIRQMADVNELGGFIQSLRAWFEQPEIVGLARLAAWPSGRATSGAFDWLRAEILESLGAEKPVDAVLLALHGAMAADGHPDVEGEILHAVRQQIGNETPLVATLDLHTNLTAQMVSAADALVVYHCAPHVDVFETGQRGAAVLRRIMIDGARPVSALVRIPAVLPAELANTEAHSGVAVDRKRQLRELEEDPQVLSAAVTTVQPWLDVPGLGSAALVVTDENSALAESMSKRLANELWQRRREYLPALIEVKDAVRQAHERRGGLTVISDSADATTSGAPGDSVWILKELLRYDWPRPALVTLVAPHVVERAEQAGAGSRFDDELGGIRDHRFGTKLRLEGAVERLFDARFIMSGHIGKNMSIDMGRSAVLRKDNVAIVVTSRSGPHFAPELFRAAGFDPFDAAVVVAKSPCGFRAAYGDRAAQIFNVRAPGCAPADFWTYPFQQISRPLWPWDEIESWQPEPHRYGPATP